MNYNFIFDNITVILNFMEAKAISVAYNFDVQTQSVDFIAVYASGEKIEKRLSMSEIERMSHKDIVNFVNKFF